MTSKDQIPHKSEGHSPSAGQRWADAAEVKARYSVSDMTLWRWEKDPRVEFPAPVKLGANGKNYWWLPRLIAWEASRAARSTKRSVPAGARSARFNPRGTSRHPIS
jgi:predicted DNA-binding transcriptional regulator AlpA